MKFLELQLKKFKGSGVPLFNRSGVRLLIPSQEELCTTVFCCHDKYFGDFLLFACKEETADKVSICHQVFRAELARLFIYPWLHTMLSFFNLLNCQLRSSSIQGFCVGRLWVCVVFSGVFPALFKGSPFIFLLFPALNNDVVFLLKLLKCFIQNRLSFDRLCLSKRDNALRISKY